MQEPISDLLIEAALPYWPVLLGLAAVVLAAIILQARIRSRKRNIAAGQYQARTQIFTPAERAFYKQLKLSVGSDFVIFGKVRLADVIEPRRGLSKSEHQGALNRILSKQLDFLLVRPDSLSIACAVELDDSSRLRSDRVVRDELVEHMLGDAGIPLARFEVQPMYSVDDISEGLSVAFEDPDEEWEPRLTR